MSLGLTFGNDGSAERFFAKSAPIRPTAWVEAHTVMSFFALPVNCVAVGLEAAVRDRRAAVVALVGFVGFLEALGHVALGVVLAGLGPVADLVEVLVFDDVGQHFVFDLEILDRVARDLFGVGRDRRDLGPDPLQLVADVFDQNDAANAGPSSRHRWHRCS